MSADDKYTYPNSGGVLINKRGFRTAKQLDRAMNDHASTGWALLSQEQAPVAFDFTYLQRIHTKLFGRLFDWAGQVRDVDTVAGNTGIVYARPRFIDQNLADMFRLLAEDDALMTTDDPDEFSASLANHWGYLSLIHPFRDGNTRSQSLFVANLSRAAGHPINWRVVDVNALREARLLAMRGNEHTLADLLLRSISGGGGGANRWAPIFRTELSNTEGVAAPELAGRCGKPRANGRGPCLRRIGDDGCPYHGC